MPGYVGVAPGTTTIYISNDRNANLGWACGADAPYAYITSPFDVPGANAPWITPPAPTVPVTVDVPPQLTVSPLPPQYPASMNVPQFSTNVPINVPASTFSTNVPQYPSTFSKNALPIPAPAMTSKIGYYDPYGSEMTLKDAAFRGALSGFGSGFMTTLGIAAGIAASGATLAFLLSRAR